MADPNPKIHDRVRVALLELCLKATKAMSPTQCQTFRNELETRYLPRVAQAFKASMTAVAMVENVVATHLAIRKARGQGMMSDSQFAMILLLEYLAISEGVFKQELRLIAFLAVQTGTGIENKGKVVPVKSIDDLQGPQFGTEHLARHARRAGFGEALEEIFDNRVRRAIAHFDFAVDEEGNVDFYDTDAKGERRHVCRASINQMQQMNWRLRDFCCSFSMVLADYAAAELD